MKKYQELNIDEDFTYGSVVTSSEAGKFVPAEELQKLQEELDVYYTLPLSRVFDMITAHGWRYVNTYWKIDEARTISMNSFEIKGHKVLTFIIDK